MEKTCEVRLVDFGSLRALVSVRLGDMEIRGFKVIDQGEGKAWVAEPDREIIRDGKKDYYKIVRFTEKEAKRESTRVDWMEK